jgi:hypothetical protein
LANGKKKTKAGIFQHDDLCYASLFFIVILATRRLLEHLQQHS